MSFNSNLISWALCALTSPQKAPVQLENYEKMNFQVSRLKPKTDFACSPVFPCFRPRGQTGVTGVTIQVFAHHTCPFYNSPIIQKSSKGAILVTNFCKKIVEKFKFLQKNAEIHDQGLSNFLFSF